MSLLDSIRGEYVRYKALGDAAIAQLDEEQLSQPLTPDSNSIAVVCWHVSGNLKSRFTDFLTSDGEKPWRQRDEEFAERRVTRGELLAKWAEGWDVVLGTLAAMSDDRLMATVTIRDEPHVVHEALHRSLAHTAYHVGQIVYIAKALRGAKWRSLSIPKGQSAAYNQRPAQKPYAHAEAIRERLEGH